MTISGQVFKIMDSIITGVFLTAISYSTLIILLASYNKGHFKDLNDLVLIIIWIFIFAVGITAYFLLNKEITYINIVDSLW